MTSGNKELLFNLLIKGAQFAAGGISGYAFSARYPTAPVGEPYLVGVGVTLIAAVFELVVRMPLESKKQQNAISEIARILSENGEKQALLLKAMSYVGKSIGHEKTDDVWLKLSAHAQTSYWATNYIEPLFYEQNHVQNILKFHRAKILTDHNFRIKKVFIWKDEAESKSTPAENIRRLHKAENDNVHMELKQVQHQQLLDDRNAMTAFKNTDSTIDFAIFDQRVVLIWFLDESRRITGGKVLVQLEEIEAFKVFFDKLFTLSQKIPD